MTPEDDFPTANNKLKSLLRSKAPWETGDDEKQDGERELSKSQQSVIRKAEASHEYAIAFIKSHFRNMGDIFTALNQATTEADDCRAELTTLRAERDILIDALLWIDTSDPELTAVAEKKFGFDLGKYPTVSRAALSSKGDDQ